MALLTGKTGAPPPAADGAEPMAYDKEVVTTEGGLEAVVQVRYSGGRSGGQKQLDCTAGCARRRAGCPAIAPRPAQDADAEANSVRPQLFKSLAGKGHAEFSSNRQQVGQGCRSLHVRVGQGRWPGGAAHQAWVRGAGPERALNSTVSRAALHPTPSTLPHYIRTPRSISSTCWR